MTDDSKAARTRARILAAAQTHFLRDGFRATTIRTIGTTAGIDPALVIRYFGSKQELWRAATDLDLDLPDFGAVEIDTLGRRIVREFLARWEGAGGRPLRLLLAAAATDPDAAARMRDIVTGQVTPAVSAAAADRPADRVRLVTGALLGFAVSRYQLALPGADDDEDAVVDLLGPALQRHLVGPLD